MLKYLLLLCLLTSCGGFNKEENIKTGAIQGSRIELKLKPLCTIVGEEVTLEQDIVLLENTIVDLFTDVTLDMEYNFTERQERYIGNFLEQLADEVAKIKRKASNAYLITLACKEKYEFKDQKAYGELKQLLKDDHYFKKLTEEGFLLIGKEQFQQFVVDLVRKGAAN